MTDTKNPILNIDCEPCAVSTPEAPTPCEVPEVVDLEVKVLPKDDCPSCDDKIVPAPVVVPDLEIETKCLTPDPAFEYVTATSCISGILSMFYSLHPGCSRPVQADNFCATENRCDEDLGLRKEYGNNNIWYIQPFPASQKLYFFVADGYEDRVLSEIGYIKVAQPGNHNEWMPRECVEGQFNLAASAPFPGSQTQFLSEYPDSGTIPTIVTVTTVLSVSGDEDEDGILNGVETFTADSDSDGNPDYVETDADSDSIADSLESGDANSDGIFDFQQP